MIACRPSDPNNDQQSAERSIVTDAQQKISLWLTSSNQNPVHIAPLWGDVSRRRYFHVTLEGGATAAAVFYPPDMRPVCCRFLATTELLEIAQVRVPKVLLSACDQGLMLVEDLGSTSLYDIGGQGWAALEPFYKDALTCIHNIQRLPSDVVSDLNPPLDGALLRQEIDISWDALIEGEAMPASRVLRQQFRDALAELLDHLEIFPLVPCHRDFMGRNLMLSGPDRVLTVIDHQDLRMGPRHYDLASLLNDSLFPPPAIEEKLRNLSIDTDNELLFYRRCSVQRTVKAAGTFVRFAAQGDKRHLPLVNPTLLRAAYHLRLLPEGGSFIDQLANQWESASANS